VYVDSPVVKQLFGEWGPIFPSLHATDARWSEDRNVGDRIVGRTGAEDDEQHQLMLLESQAVVKVLKVEPYCFVVASPRMISTIWFACGGSLSPLRSPLACGAKIDVVACT
jgi:hypothetical protein